MVYVKIVEKLFLKKKKFTKRSNPAKAGLEKGGVNYD